MKKFFMLSSLVIFGILPSACIKPEAYFHACYYQGNALTEETLLGCDDEEAIPNPVPESLLAIDHQWGSDPVYGDRSDDLSGVWTGKFYFKKGTYLFSVTSDDGVRLFINGQPVIEAWQDQASTQYSAAIDLQGKTDIRVEWYEASGGAILQLRWDKTERDDDGDGYSELQGDCDDSNESVHPGAEDLPCDGIDRDCNGIPEGIGETAFPLWRVLLLVYHSINVNCTDEYGADRHFEFTLPSDEILNGVSSFEAFPALAADLSDAHAIVFYKVIHVSRSITSLSPLGEGVYWPSPDDTKPELDAFASAGSYDSVMVLWPKDNFSTGEGVPSWSWGLSIGAGPESNGATYATVANATEKFWQEPNIGEVWLHEWLHGVSYYYEDKGYSIPAGNADGAESHGYEWTATEGWAPYYHDLMTGRVIEDGVYTGITAEAWGSGAIRGEYICE